MFPPQSFREPVTARPTGITVRSLVLGFLLVIAFSVAGCYSVFLRYEIIGTGYLPRGAISLLLLLVLGNAGVGRLVAKWKLSRAELLLIFVMLLAMAAIPGQEFAQHIYLNTAGLTYLSGARGQYLDLFTPHIKPWLVPSLDPDAKVITDLFQGIPAGSGVPYAGWLTTFAVWTPYWFVLYWSIMCWSAMLSRQWERHERLTYPLAQVPVEVVDDEKGALSSLLRSRLMWGCFAFSAGLYVIKGLHTYYPIIPDLKLQGDTGVLFGGGPASEWNGIPLHFYPEMVGIAYLLTSEVSFSLWFFYILRQFLEMTRYSMGLFQHADFFQFQTVGGYLVLAGATLWAARLHLKDIVRGAVGLPTKTDGADNPLPYGVAFWGAVLSFGALVAWASAAGVSVPWALMLYALFPLVAIVVSRVICEGGMFIYTSPFRLNELLFDVIGCKRLGPQNLTVMTMLSWVQIRSTATQNMPAVLQGFRIGSLANLNRRQVTWAMFASICLAILTCHVTSLSVIYNSGVGKLGWWPSRAAQGTAAGLASFMQTPQPMTSGDWTSMVSGGLVTFFLVKMRQQFVWWPFHPVGYVAWIGWPLERYWLSIFLGWLLKAGILRWAGYQLWRKLRPGAFGLILGICFVLTFWIVAHFFWPGPVLIVE